MALPYILRSGMVISPISFFLLRSTLAIGDLLYLCVDFRIVFFFSISVKNEVGVLIGIALNL